MSQFQQEFIATVIEHYGLEPDDRQVETVIAMWFQTYNTTWIVKALIESLYRGRYKVKSVDNILRDWQRRGSPLNRFTPDYEREICQSLPFSPNLPATVLLSPERELNRELPESYPPATDRPDLDPEESAPFQHHNRPLGTTNSADERVEADVNAVVTPVTTDSLSTTPASAEPIERATTPLPPAELAAGEREIKPNDRLDAPQTKSHLFNILRAIVEPKQEQGEEFRTISSGVGVDRTTPVRSEHPQME